MEETELELNEFQRWVKDYYEARGWSELNHVLASWQKKQVR